MKKVLITGISGQDGSYLSELLIEKGYQVHGIVMDVELTEAATRLTRLKKVYNQIQFHVAQLDNFSSVLGVYNAVKPDECYHLAAQSFVDYTFENEFSTMNINLHGTHNVLAAIKLAAPACKLYYAGSSEMFGLVKTSPQDENTAFNPRSIYGISKVAGYHLSVNYRNLYGLFCSNGILYNHESERRGHEFVTRKIIQAAVKIKLGRQNCLKLGNMDARRDWGYAPDYVRAMWQILQYETPQDFVIGTGVTHSIKELVEIAFECLDLKWQNYVEISQELFRPAEQVELKANPQKAVQLLGWKPSIDFETMIQRMVQSDYEEIKNG